MNDRKQLRFTATTNKKTIKSNQITCHWLAEVMIKTIFTICWLIRSKKFEKKQSPFVELLISLLNFSTKWQCCGKIIWSNNNTSADDE